MLVIWCVFSEDAEIIIMDPMMVINRNSSQQIATGELNLSLWIDDLFIDPWLGSCWFSHTQAYVVTKKEKTDLLCNIMGRSEFCEIKGDIRIDRSSSTASIVSSADILAAESTSWSIRPYARKEALGEKDFSRNWSVKLVTDRPDIAQCTSLQ